MMSAIPAQCATCGGRGKLDCDLVRGFRSADFHRRPDWCTCPEKTDGGPFVAPPGVVVAFRYRSPRDPGEGLRDALRAAGNAERAARDALAERFVRAGKGWRELPKTSKRRQSLERAYARAKAALRKLQAECPHPERSLYDPACCGLCYRRLAS